jgi:hypothetical protein
MAAERLHGIIAEGRDEAEAFAEYERACRNTFRRSFLWAGMFRGLVRTPLMDVVMRLGEFPVVRRAAARVLASL